MLFNILWLIAVFVLVSGVIADIRQALKGRPFLRLRILFDCLPFVLWVSWILAIYKIDVEGSSFLKEGIFMLSMSGVFIYLIFGEFMGLLDAYARPKKH